MMNRTIIRLTAHSLLGRRRVLVLSLLPAALLALTILVRALGGADDSGTTEGVIAGFGLGTLMPLLGLIAGTGAIGPEIEDGSLVYMLAKPQRRITIMLSKLAVATATVLAFGALPIFVCAIILDGELHPLATSYAAAAAVAALVYSALFLLLAAVTRNAVVIGLLYALVWESLVGQFVPGARALSVQQWALTFAERVADLGDGALSASSAVDFSTAVMAIVVTVVACVVLTTRQLDRIPVSHDA